MLVVLDSAVAEEGREFLLERLLSMVYLLILDVPLHHGNLRRAYAERPIALLPREIRPHPMGGATFELLNSRGEGNLWRQRDEQVDVIRGAAGCNEAEALALCDAVEIGV